jgi:SPP1 gp7 family putative phage head morphogenesis protein
MIGAQQTAARAHMHRRLGLAKRRYRVPDARPPTLIESDYASALVGLVRGLREQSAPILDSLPAILRADGLRLDDGSRGRKIRRLIDSIRGRLATSTTMIEGLAARYARQTSAHQRAELMRQGRAALGIDLVIHDPHIASVIDSFVHENVALIDDLRGRAMSDMEMAITRAVATGTRAEQLGLEIAARFGLAEQRARRIARDQIGRLNGQISRSRHLELGIKSFIWQSMRDPRVRPEHRHLDGKEFEYARPPSEGIPGHPIMCRCVPKPVFKAIYAELDALGV